jgi:hypothetical protein
VAARWRCGDGAVVMGDDGWQWNGVFGGGEKKRGGGELYDAGEMKGEKGKVT